MVLGPHERRFGIFCSEDFGVGKGDLGRLAFEEGIAEGEDVGFLYSVRVMYERREKAGAYSIFMAILAAQDVWAVGVGKVLSYCGNVDEQTRVGVYPPRINDVESVALVSDLVMRVDFQHVISAIGYAGGAVVKDRHVVVGGEKLHRIFGDLDVYVGIPRQDLSEGVVRRENGEVRGTRHQRPTFLFHHQPSSVPCMIQVSTPMSIKVERKV